MPLVIQTMTMSGRIVEGARWVVDLPWIQEGHTVSLNLPVKDPALIGYVSKQRNLDCVVDREGAAYNISLSCKVLRLRHMVNTSAGTTESLAYITPASRLVESVLTYMLQPAKCDPRFMAAVRGDARPMGSPAS